MQPLVPTTECTLLFQPFCPAVGDYMAVLLAMRAGQLVARLVDGGKWTLLANTNRHLVRRDTDEARQRACPGDGTLIIRPCYPLSGGKGGCAFSAPRARESGIGNVAAARDINLLPGGLPGLEVKLPRVKSTRDIPLVICLVRA